MVSSPNFYFWRTQKHFRGMARCIILLKFTARIFWNEWCYLFLQYFIYLDSAIHYFIAVHQVRISISKNTTSEHHLERKFEFQRDILRIFKWPLPNFIDEGLRIDFDNNFLRKQHISPVILIIFSIHFAPFKPSFHCNFAKKLCFSCRIGTNAFLEQLHPYSWGFSLISFGNSAELIYGFCPILLSRTLIFRSLRFLGGGDLFSMLRRNFLLLKTSWQL